MRSEVNTTILSIVSIAIGIIAIISEQQRILIISLFAIFIAGYYLYSIYNKIYENSEAIKNISGSINTQKDLINIKASLNSLEREVFKKVNKKGISDKDFLNYLRIAAGIALAYVIYKAIMAQIAG